MRTARSALGAATLFVLVSCGSGSQAQTSPRPSVSAATQAPTSPGPPVAGVLNAPPSPQYLPGEAAISAPSSQVVWVLVNFAYLYRSMNRGQSWEQRPLPPTLLLPPYVSFVSDVEGWLLTAGSPETQCNSQSEVIWHTIDAGATWRQMPGTGIAAAQCKRGIWFGDQNHGYLGAWDDNHRPTVYRTSDGGLSWAGYSLPDPPGFVTQAGGFSLQAGVVREFNGTALLAAYGNQAEYVYRSGGAGSGWTYAGTSTDAPENVAFVSATRWLKIGNDGNGFETVDGGRSWHAFSCDYGDAAGVASMFVFADASVGYGTVRGTIYATADGGLHWVTLKTPGIGQPG